MEAYLPNMLTIFQQLVGNYAVVPSAGNRIMDVADRDPALLGKELSNDSQGQGVPQ